MQARTTLRCFAAAAVLLVAGAYAVSGDDWRSADLSSSDLNAVALEAYRKLCQDSGADACLVAHRGRIVLEWYGSDYSVPAYTMSSVKSWTALLVGLLIEDGLVAGVDDPVSRYFPEWEAGAEAGVTIRHLLTMTSGLRGRTAQTGPNRSVGFVDDKRRFVAGLLLDWKPGRRWDYSNEGVQILSPVLTAAAGESLNAYAQKRLFGLLGMEDTRLHEHPPGQVWTYADAETTLRDFARIGQVVLDGGMHNGVRVLPRWWIDECLRPSERNRRYGYLWWIHYENDLRGPLRRLLNLRRQPRPKDLPVAYATHGYLDTDCYVLPSQGIVAARMQGRPKTKIKAYDREAAIQLLKKVAP